MIPSLQFDAPSHVYRWRGERRDSVTQIIRGALGNPFERVAAPVLEFARQRGKAVHRACELDDAGQLDESTVDARIVPYVDAWRTFRRQWKFDVLFSETPLYSEQHGFAGTPDVVVWLPTDELAVIDRKTGLPAPGSALQTAGYAQLVHETVGLAIPRRFALHMKKTGRYEIVEYDNPGDWREFLACLVVNRLQQRIAA